MIRKDYLIDINEFRKLKAIGKGNSAQVFIIQNITTQKKFAAKVYYVEINKFARKEIAAINREITNMFNTYFPSIVKFYGFSKVDFDSEPHPILITELVTNGTLSQIIQKEKDGKSPTNWTDTKKLINIYGIASAMDYLHSKSIIHRDLKPSNILETRHFHPKICDFGLSKLNKSLEQLQQQPQIMAGTQYYIAPEVLAHNDYTPQCDVYSFAMTVYFLMTGSDPSILNDSNIPYFQYVLKIIQGERPRFTKEIPYRYQKLIEDCWCEKPENRPTFSKIVEDLKNDKDFITETVNEDEYLKYIEYIKSLGDEEYEEELFEDEDEEEEEEETLEPFILPYPEFDWSDYKVVETIGCGGFANVYKINDKNTGKIFAAKILKSEYQKNDQNTPEGNLLRREVNCLSASNHPAIVKFIGYSPIDFRKSFKPSIIIEYLHNGSIEDVIELGRKKIAKDEWNDTMKLISIFGIASAMKYLHSHQIIHRDLKPGNVMLDENLFPKLSDFGLSKSLDENSSFLSKVMGTCQFMAPEIFTKGYYTKAGDVYAFGMLVYEIMTATYPFFDCNWCMVARLVNEGYRPEFKRLVPPAYQNMIEICWNQNPEDRPTFDEIVPMLKEKAFITEKVDENLYRSYINLIENGVDEGLFQKHSLTNLYEKLNSIKAREISNQQFMNLSNYKQLSRTRKRGFFDDYEIKDKKSGMLLSASISKMSQSFTDEENISLSKEVHFQEQLNHPSLLKFYGISLVDFNGKDNPIMITESTKKMKLLSEILKKERIGKHSSKWNSTNKMIIMYGIASAMAYLHLNEINHPYLNTNNIFIDTNSFIPKLTETGNCLNEKIICTSSCTTSNAFDMSMCYIAPEIAPGSQKSEKSDVYSYALIVFEIVTGDAPFESNSIFSKITEKNERPEFKKDIPDALKNLIERSWNQDPNERPSFCTITEKLENEMTIDKLAKDPFFAHDKFDKEIYFSYVEKCKKAIVKVPYIDIK